MSLGIVLVVLMVAIQLQLFKIALLHTPSKNQFTSLEEDRV